MIQNKYIIGITGGIGTGKSTILHYLKQNYRISVISADAVGKTLMKPGDTVYLALVEHYGEGILNDDSEKTINTKKLAEICFASDEAQKEINAIEHPLIRDEIFNGIHDAIYPIVFLEAALLVEGGLSEICDEIWVVTADHKTRVERLMKYRGLSEKQCNAIISKQMTEEQFSEVANTMIDNSGLITETAKQIDQLMAAFLENHLSLILGEKL